MKRKAILFLALALVGGLSGCAMGQAVDTTAHDEFIAEAEEKAQAAWEAVGEDWTMNSRTEVVSFPLRNDQGDTISSASPSPVRRW